MVIFSILFHFILYAGTMSECKYNFLENKVNTTYETVQTWLIIQPKHKKITPPPQKKRTVYILFYIIIMYIVRTAF